MSAEFKSFPKHIAKVVRWLMNGASTDVGRPVLNGIHVNGHATSANGFALHTANVDGLTEGLHRYSRIGRLGKETVFGIEPIEGSFPNAAAVFPNKEPVAVIAVDTKLLRQALDGLDGACILRIYGATEPMELRGRIETREMVVINGKRSIKETSTDVCALIMPMDVGDGGDVEENALEAGWRPVFLPGAKS